MEESLKIARVTQDELGCIDEVMDIQTEKYIEIQKKLGNGKSIILNTSLVMKKLEDALKMKRIIISITTVFIVFTSLLIIIKYY